MLLGTLGASLLRNLLAGQGKIRASECIIKSGHVFLMPPHPFEILKTKSIIKMDLNLMVFIQEIIYVK